MEWLGYIFGFQKHKTIIDSPELNISEVDNSVSSVECNSRKPLEFSSTTIEKENHHAEIKTVFGKNVVYSENVGTSNNYFNTYTVTPAQKKKKSHVSFGIFDHVLSFQGREDVIKRLDQLFTEYIIIAVYGIGGVGKTQLARYYANSYTLKHSGNNIWIKGEKYEKLVESFRALAADLDISIKDRDIRSIVQDVYAYFQGSKTFFVIDNALNRAVIQEFLPVASLLQDGSLKILITTQFGDWDTDIPALYLEELSVDSALGIFSYIVGEHFDKIAKEEWEQLALTFYCIPLGLQIGACYVRQRLSVNKRFSIREYIQRLQEEDVFFNKKLPTGSVNSYQKTIYISLRFTLEKIISSDEFETKLALILINVCAYLDPDNITDRHLLKIDGIDGSRDNLEEALNVLKDYSFVTFMETQRNRWNGQEYVVIQVHRLVQQFFRYDQEKHDNVPKYYEKVLTTFVTPPDVIGCIKNWLYSHTTFILKYVKYMRLFFESLTSAKIKLLIDDRKLLHIASNALLYETMCLLIEYGADINCLHENKFRKRTPMVFLLETNYQTQSIKVDKFEKCLMLLIQHGANVTFCDRCGRNVLHWAAYWKCPAVITAIIKQGSLAIINRAHSYGNTPLHYVVSLCKVDDEAEIARAKECIRLLTMTNSTVSCSDPAEHQPSFQHPSDLDMGMKAEGCCISVQNDTNLEMKTTISAVDHKGETILHVSARYNNWPLVEFLIDEYHMDSNVLDNDNGNTPLLLVPQWNNVKNPEELHRTKLTIQSLVQRNACIDVQNKNGTGMLHLAATLLCAPLIEHLIDDYHLKIHQTDNQKRTALIYLAAKFVGPDELDSAKICLKLLLKRGASITDKDSRGRSILCHAAASRSWLLVQYLVQEHQMDPNLQDDEGKTPLMLVENEEKEKTLEVLEQSSKVERAILTIKALVSAGAKFDMKCNKGRTLLHEVVLTKKRNPQILKFLINECHLDPNELDNDGATPLHFIAGAKIWNLKNAKIYINILMKGGAKIDLKDKNGRTAVQYAAENDNHCLIPLLIPPVSNI